MMRMMTCFTAFTILVACTGQNDLELELILDQYGNETQWTITGPAGVVASGGPYTQQSSAGEYPLPLMTYPNLPDGQYSFAITDAANDGLCCGYGNGSYELRHTQSGTIVASGGAFGGSETINFTLPATQPPVMATPFEIDLELFASGLNGPVDLAHAGDSRLFAVEQDGRIMLIDSLGNVNPVPFLDIDPQVNSSGNEQGLLGLAFHPNFPDSNYFYVNYTASGGGNGGTTRISRFTVSADPDVADPNSELIIYTASQFASNHNGGDLDFGPDGYLYIPTGDGGAAGDPGDRAQSMDDQMGKIIRIDVDGGPLYTVPSSNPYANTAFPQDTLPEIWAVGLRNPWRFGFDALTGDVWIGDVGQNAYEEVDFWPAGDNSGPNFGWRCYEGNNSYNTSGCLPMSAYVGPASEHQQTLQGWCSVIGGRVYRGNEFPRLYGRYIYTDYCGGQFYSLMNDNMGGWIKEEVLSSVGFGMTAIAENSDLDMFVAKQNGEIYKIIDPCPDTIPGISFDGSMLSSTSALSYTWFLNGNELVGDTLQSFTPIMTGTYYVIAQTSAECFLQSDTLQVIVSGVGESVRNRIAIFPVPASEAVTLSFDRPLSDGEAVLFDLEGRAVLRRNWNEGERRMQLDVSDIATGNYLLKVVDGSGVLIATAKVVMTR